MMSTTITFDYNLFTTQIPEYSNAILYPSATVQNWWNIATNYMTANVGFALSQNARAYGLNLLTAHLIYLNALISQGQDPGIVNAATIDKVNVSLTPPQIPNQWQYWLNTSPYGKMLLALLQVNATGGFYVGGSTQRAAFGYQGGCFGPWTNG